MQVELMYQPAFTLGRLLLRGSEQVRVEASSMVGMSTGTTLETKTGGIMQALKRSFLGGESFFQNIYTAPAQGGEVWVAPSLPGDLNVLTLSEPMLIQSGAYVASDMAITLDTKWGGSKSFFGTGAACLCCGPRGRARWWCRPMGRSTK